MTTKAKRKAIVPLKDQPVTIWQAIYFMKQARNNLRACGCKNAADYIARALKSAEGAHRHAVRMHHQETYQ